MTTLSDDGTRFRGASPADAPAAVADDGSTAVSGAVAWARDSAIAQRPATRLPFDPPDPAAALAQLPEAVHLLAIGIPRHRRRWPALTRLVGPLLPHLEVALVPEGYTPRPGAPVVVTVEGSVADHGAIEAAFTSASLAAAPLVAVHCWKEPGALSFPSPAWCPIDWADQRDRECALVAERLADHSGRYPDVMVDRVIRTGQPGSALLPLARSAQLVVIPGREDGLLAARLSALLDDAAVPVLLT